MTLTRLAIRGMHCASCVARVETALQAAPGVTSASVNLLEGTADVRSAGDQPLEPLIKAVETAGYGAAPLATPQAGQSPATAAADEAQLWERRLIVASALLIPLLALHWVHLPLHAVHAVAMLLLGTVMQVYVGGPYLVAAIKQIRHGGVSMDTLIAIGTNAAYLAGLAELAGWPMGGLTFMEAGMILAFVTLGKFLEARAKGRASRAVQGLLSLAPPQATVQRNGAWQTLPVAEARLGERLLVKPGEKVPLDARVIAGNSDVNEAWLTGESLPVDKTPGSTIYAGTVNGLGSLEAEIIKAADETWLAQIVELVRQAQSSKANLQRLADRVVAWFVPVVLAIALATFIGWAVLAPEGWRQGLSAAIAVLVVACPCALGLAAPAAVTVATGRAAESGVLFKSAEALETLAGVQTMVFDKTGTLTRGQPEVVRVLPAADIAEEELLAAAYAAERLSQHPLARAVVRYAESRKVAPLFAPSLTTVPGEGIEAQSSAGLIFIGHEAALAKRGIAVPPALHGELAQAMQSGATAVLVTINSRLLGAVLIADQTAPQAAEAIEELQTLGLATTLLSGDRRTTAEALAAKLGIPSVLAEVKPDGKQQTIVQLQKSGVVAMVGDGLNDAPALTQADVGIAIGSGADVAIESADVILTRHDLRLLARAVRLARATFAVIRQNLFWALAYNLVLIPLATGALVPLWGLSLSPALASAAMAASSVSVVLNSLRLRSVRI